MKAAIKQWVWNTSIKKLKHRAVKDVSVLLITALHSSTLFWQQKKKESARIIEQKVMLNLALQLGDGSIHFLGRFSFE